MKAFPSSGRCFHLAVFHVFKIIFPRTDHRLGENPWRYMRVSKIWRAMESCY